MCTSTKIIEAATDLGYQIVHCTEEQRYQALVKAWVKAGQHGAMPMPNPSAGIGCRSAVACGVVYSVVKSR